MALQDDSLSHINLEEVRAQRERLILQEYQARKSEPGIARVLASKYHVHFTTVYRMLKKAAARS